MALRELIGGALGAAAVATVLAGVSGTGHAAVTGADARQPVQLTIAHARISRTTGEETLQAFLTDARGRHPVGRRIAYTSRHGYALCAADTDRTGVAECRVDPRTTQADPDEMMSGVRATFAGDRTYRPATGTAPTDVIFP